MDLSVLHPSKEPDRSYKWKDRLNNLTGHLDCRFLEWTDWYNYDISQRLLGHYRLFQLFKAENRTRSRLSLPLAYIINYRALHSIKCLFSHFIGALYFVCTFGGKYYPCQLQSINKLLVNDFSFILDEFLTESENDFERALIKTVGKISNIRFINPSGIYTGQQPVFFFQLPKNLYNAPSSSPDNNALPVDRNTEKALKGKEKGVFSKKQILIFFDLLSEMGMMEKIDFSKPNKFEPLADLLFAITGKSRGSWMEQLKEHRTKSLYDARTPGELNQLTATITNLAEIFRSAGFRSIACRADKKLRELDKLKRDLPNP